MCVSVCVSGVAIFVGTLVGNRLLLWGDFVPVGTRGSFRSDLKLGLE